MARYVHSASVSLRPLRDRLESLGGDEAAMLAGHINAFLNAAHAGAARPAARPSGR